MSASATGARVPSEPRVPSRSGDLARPTEDLASEAPFRKVLVEEKTEPLPAEKKKKKKKNKSDKTKTGKKTHKTRHAELITPGDDCENGLPARTFSSNNSSDGRQIG